MILFSNHKIVIFNQLQNYQDVFIFDEKTNIWCFVENKKENTGVLRLKTNYFNGGIAKLIEILNNYRVAYMLTRKEPSIRISIDTIY